MSKGLSSSQLRKHRLTRIYQRLNSNLCFFCEKEKGITIDHFVPLCLGGTNHEFNLVAACNSCNNDKDCKVPEQKFIDKWIAQFNPPQEFIEKFRDKRAGFFK